KQCNTPGAEDCTGNEFCEYQDHKCSDDYFGDDVNRSWNVHIQLPSKIDPCRFKHIIYLQAEEYHEDREANQRHSQKLRWRIYKLREQISSSASLFRLLFEVEAVRTVECHLNPCKKSHEHQREYEPDYGFPFPHAVKIEYGWIRRLNLLSAPLRVKETGR